MQCCFQLANVLHRRFPSLYTTAPNMSQICSMGFKSRLMAGQGTEVTASLLEVGGYCSCTMRPGVVIHIHRPCSQWVVVEMGDNNWLQDVSDVLITS